MPRIKIYRVDEVGDDDLADLLEEADCDVIDCEDEGPVDALVVLLGPDLSGDADLEKSLVRATAQGLRIICVWPKDGAYGEAPPSIEKYSSDQVSWDAQKLAAAVGGVGEPFYDAPDGTPRPQPDTPRHECE